MFYYLSVDSFFDSRSHAHDPLCIYRCCSLTVPFTHNFLKTVNQWKVLKKILLFILILLLDCIDVLEMRHILYINHWCIYFTQKSICTIQFVSFPTGLSLSNCEYVVQVNIIIDNTFIVYWIMSIWKRTFHLRCWSLDDTKGFKGIP